MGQVNLYGADITKYYDQIVENFYFDYDSLVSDLVNLIGKERKHILEIGVGTGLVSTKLRGYGYQISGVDNSQEMLHIAESRLGRSTPLYLADIQAFNPEHKYDAVFSIMGPWYSTRKSNGELKLLSYISTAEGNLQGLINIRKVLNPGGILVLSIQAPHESITERIFDKQYSYYHLVNQRSRLIIKDYIVSKGGEEVARQKCRFIEYLESEIMMPLEQLGFSGIMISNCGNFIYTYAK